MSTEPSRGFEAKLDGILARHAELGQAIAEARGESYAALAKEYAELEPVAGGIRAWRAAAQEAAGLEEMIADSKLDRDMRALAEDELRQLERRLPELEHAVKVALLPSDEADARGAILEIRAGTGGEEAALFAGDLYRMYQRYAELRGWRFEPLSVSDTGRGGIKEVIVAIKGRGVFRRLKYEAGVHRVQRVPVTEASGRIHTSAATVAVLPEAEDVDVKIDDNELRIDVYRSSGPGGQSVNTTDSAVRITHLPTGIVVIQQDEKSQHKNKAKALRVLRARLYERERAAREAERAASRKGQVGSGDRSERIRTYNFPQSRCTDHRINLTLYKLDQILAGEALDQVVDALIAEDEAARLAETA
ncbi:MAG: peptide chain release factor 1 [Geminicoccaceae bacterium]